MNENDFPNVLIINDQSKKPEEIIGEYVEFFCDVFKLRDKKNLIEDVLYSFWDDVEYWISKESLIEGAKFNLAALEELEKQRKLIDGDYDE